MKVSTKSSNLTNYTGIKFFASRNELEEIFGEPMIINDDKQIFQYNVENINGDIVTVYDWCSNHRIYQDKDWSIYWNVGSLNPNAAIILKIEIDEKLKEIRYGRK